MSLAQGLALLTLSWDKNWDSHSLVNGYPSFYPARISLVAPSPGGEEEAQQPSDRPQPWLRVIYNFCEQFTDGCERFPILTNCHGPFTRHLRKKTVDTRAIIRTNAGILLIRTLRTNFNEIISEIHTFSFNKMHLKMSSAKWRHFCLGPNLKMANISSVPQRVKWHSSSSLLTTWVQTNMHFIVQSYDIHLVISGSINLPSLAPFTNMV